MWSGPRNISTAMMRAWGNRPDTLVCDEPLYAHYLKQTGYTHHPGYAEILEHHETDWRQVVEELTGPLPEGKTVFYQKQMAQHLLPNISLDWTDKLTNLFLIRDPREVLLSLIEFFPEPTVEETGLPQQLQLFNRVRQLAGDTPVVLDSRDVLEDPQAMLSEVCRRIDLPFDERMLHWPAGPRDTDGVWGGYWYVNLTKSTSFAPYHPRTGVLPPQHTALLAECQSIYDELAKHRIVPG